MSRIDEYIRDVLSQLPVSPKDRARIEADLRDHLNSSVAAGESEEEAVLRMGPSAEVAAELMSTLTPLYAPRASRLGAMIFDFVLAYAFTGALAIAALTTFFSPEGVFGSEAAPFVLIPLTFAVISLLPLSYFVFSEWLTGRTVGKWLFGLTVSDEKGHSPSFASALVRRLSVFFGPLFMLDGATLLFTEKRQRATELLAHTVVLRVPEGLSPVVGWAGVVTLIASVAALGALVYSRLLTA